MINSLKFPVAVIKLNHVRKTMTKSKFNFHENYSRAIDFQLISLHKYIRIDIESLIFAWARNKMMRC